MQFVQPVKSQNPYTKNKLTEYKRAGTRSSPSVGKNYCRGIGRSTVKKKSIFGSFSFKQTEPKNERSSPIFCYISGSVREFFTVSKRADPIFI